MKYPILTIATLTAAVAAPLMAAPLKLAHIAADSSWVAHADMDRLRQTEIGKRLMAGQQHPEAARRLEALQAVTGIDLLNDIADLTLYGRDEEDQNTVVVCRGTLDTEQLTRLVRGSETYDATTHGTHTIHGWNDPKRGAGVNAFGAVIPGKAVILGQATGPVQRALDLMDGKSASLAPESQLAALVRNKQAPIVLAAARFDQIEHLAPQAAVLREATAGTLCLTEAAGKVMATLALDTESAETAQRIQAVAQGLQAFGMLNASGKPAMAEMARNMRISVAGQSVQLQLAFPIEKVLDMLDGQQKWKQPPANDFTQP